jgi:hypothetical protein
VPPRSSPQRNNRSTGINGVTRYFKVDRRKRGNPRYLVIAVSWADRTGRRRVKAFSVGREGTYSSSDEQRALQAAVRFRRTYERLRKGKA